MITDAQWADVDQTTIVVQPTGAFVGLRVAGDPLSAGSGPARDALKSFLDGGGVVGAFAPSVLPTDDAVYTETFKSQRLLKAYVLALNDGSIVPGSNMTGAQLKAAIKAKM